MKRNNSKGTLETISAKMVFDLVHGLGEGNHSGFSIYDTTTDSEEKRYRVDCGGIGSFDIAMFSGEEEYNLKYDDWIWIEGIIYRYTSCSTTYNGYPYLTIEVAYDKLNKK